MARKPVQILNDRSMEKLLTATLPKSLAKRYLRLIQHWIKHKGPEWTATRLKALWNIALLVRSGDLAQIPEVMLSARIAGADGLPRGVEGVLVRLWANVQKPSRIRAMAVPFRAYTAIRLTNESSAQIAKSKKSINDPGVYTPGLRPISQRNQKDIASGRFQDYETVETLLPFTRLMRPKALRFDNLSRLSGVSSYPHLLNIPGKDIKETPFLSMCASMLTKGRVPQPLIEKLGDFHMRKSAEGIQQEAGDDTYGKISIIQEGGAKGRVVCSPNAWVQFYCKPYHNYLMRVLVSLEMWDYVEPSLAFGTSCALDQVAGVRIALNRLNSGSFCHAVDLSSATDRFPLQLQKLLCEELGIPEFALALEELRGPYKGLDGEKWTYGAGQPMGLYGSFPLFHLTHFALLNALAFKLRLEPNGMQFVVLGDDVLIFDEGLLRLYLKTLEGYQVPISWHKSYKGNLVEFAGFLIVKSRNTWTAFRPYKYGAHGEMSSVLNVLHACGAQTRGWSKYWAKAFSVYQATAGLRKLDLSPLVPSEDDNHQVGSTPGLAWFGTVFTRCSYYTTTKGTYLPEEACCTWNLDRYDLCQTQISEFNHFYTGKAVATDRVFDSVTFAPEQYQREETARKRTFFSMFWKDPVVRDLQHGGVAGCN